MFRFTQIQLHDHPSVFGIAEIFIAIAAELSVRLCYIAAQRLLKLLRNAAPRDHIAPTGVPTSTMQARSLSSSERISST